MTPLGVSLLVFLVTLILVSAVAIFILWLKRGHRDNDTVWEWLTIMILAGVAAALLAFAIALDPGQLPAALVQVAGATIAGLFVGIVILALDRRP